MVIGSIVAEHLISDFPPLGLMDGWFDYSQETNQEALQFSESTSRVCNHEERWEDICKQTLANEGLVSEVAI